MSDCTAVERRTFDQPTQQGRTAIDHGNGVQQHGGPSLRNRFRKLGPGVFDESGRSFNRTNDSHAWVTNAQLDESRQI